MTTETTEVDDLATAEREAHEAQELIAQLEGRVVAGDDTVTAGDLDAQRGLARFAQLRLQAARNRAAKVKSDRQAAAEVALKTGFDKLNGGVDGLKPLDTAFDTLLSDLQAAVAKYRAVVAKRDDKVTALVRQALEDGVPSWSAAERSPEPRTYVVTGARRPMIVVEGVTMTGGHPAAEGGRLVSAVDATVRKALEGTGL